METAKLNRGALIKLGDTLVGPVPNFILFQYNPTEMTHTMSPFNANESKKTSGKLAKTEQPGDPEEKFNMKLEFNALDADLFPGMIPGKFQLGVADRLAALEFLLYPTQKNTGSNFGPDSSVPVPSGKVPLVLFYWGPGRILPVRVTAFSVAEQQYSPALYPIRATATIELRVLTDAQIDNLAKLTKSDLTFAEELGKKAYQFTLKQKKVLAGMNLVTNLEETGLLPF